MGLFDLMSWKRKDPEYIKKNVIPKLQSKKDIKQLIVALEYTHPDGGDSCWEAKGVQADAAYAIGELGDPAAIPALTRAAKEKENYEAIIAIGKINTDSSLEILREILTTGDTTQRQGALQGLALNRTKKATKIMALAFYDNDHNNRELAARLIGETSDIDILNALMKILSDEDENVRMYAQSSFSKISKSPQAHQAIAEYINNENKADVNALELENMIEIAGKIKCIQSVPGLLSMLKLKKVNREIIVTALAKIGNSSSFEPLLNIFQYERFKPRTLPLALAATGGSRATVTLINMLKQEPNDEIIIALGQIRDVSSVEPLIEVMLNNKDFSGVVADALGEIGDRRALAALEKVLRPDFFLDASWLDDPIKTRRVRAANLDGAGFADGGVFGRRDRAKWAIEKIVGNH